MNEMMKAAVKSFFISNSLSLSKIFRFIFFCLLTFSFGKRNIVTIVAETPKSVKTRNKLLKPNSEAIIGPTINEVINAIPIIMPVIVKL